MSRPGFVPTPDMRDDFDVCKCGHDRWQHQWSIRCSGSPNCECPEFRLSIAASPSPSTSDSSKPQIGDAAVALIHATRDLAELSIVNRAETSWFGISYSVTTRTFCRVCSRASLNGIPIEHAPSCVVGIALFAAGQLAAHRTVRVPVPSQAETEALRRMTPAKISTEQNFLAGPVRHIEYEVEGHPWASEEGCAPPVRTHEEAAAARTEVFGDGQ